jgi:hypothetical protein
VISLAAAKVDCTGDILHDILARIKKAVPEHGIACLLDCGAHVDVRDGVPGVDNHPLQLQRGEHDE